MKHKLPVSWLCSLVVALHVTGAADVPISLNGIANKSLDDSASGDGRGGWTDEGPENSLNTFPTGHVEFEGIPFEIPADSPAVLALKGRSWPSAPSELTIPINGLKGRAIYFLSAHAWEDGPVELARLVVRYGSGREESLPIIHQTHTGQWWTPVSLPAAPVAWRGENRHGVPVGIYLSGYDLTNEPISAITLKSSPINGQLLILGLTISEKPVSSLPHRAAWVREPDSRGDWFPLAQAADSSSPPVWQQIPSNAPEVSGRLLLMELAPALSAPPRKVAADTVLLLKSLGYTGVRIGPLDPLLSPRERAAHRELIDELASILQANGLSLSVTLAGGRIYSENDGVAAFREIDPRLSEHFFLDSAATDILHQDLAGFRTTLPVATLAPSAVLFDSGLFSYHVDDLTRPHRRILLNLWAAWLRTRYDNQIKLEKAWQIPGQASPLLPDDNLARSKVELLSLSHILAASPRFRMRIGDQITFLDELQRKWFLDQKTFAEENMPPSLWSTTAWISPAWLRDIQTGLSASLDVVEDRTEILRPDVSPEDGKSPFLEISPFSSSGLADFLTPYYRVAGKPFIVWDTTGTWPGDRDFLRTLRTMTMAALQNWTGILHRTLYSIDIPQTLTETGATPGPALQNPAFVGVLPLGRHLFLRRDLDPAPIVLRRPLLLPSEIATKLPEIPSRRNPLGTRFPAWIPFAGGVETGSGLEDWRDEAALEKCQAEGTVTSVTGQLTLRPESDLMEIRTPRTIALVGTLNGKSLDASGVTLTGAKGYGAAYVTTLDGLPLSESRSMLIGLVGRCDNSHAVFEQSTEPRGSHDTVWRMSQAGSSPLLMEPVSADFSFPSASPGRWTITPLDVFGRALGSLPRPLPSTPEKGLSLSLENRNYGTPLFLFKYED